MEANDSWYLFQAMQQGFGLSRCIQKKCYIVCIVCVFCSFCWISSANPKLGQRRASPDAEWKNLTGQGSGSNCSVRKVMVFIYKGSVYWWGKQNVANERLPWLTFTSRLCNFFMYISCVCTHVYMHVHLCIHTHIFKGIWLVRCMWERFLPNTKTYSS